MLGSESYVPLDQITVEDCLGRKEPSCETYAASPGIGSLIVKSFSDFEHLWGATDSDPQTCLTTLETPCLSE